MSNAKKKEILFVFEGQKGKTRRARELETAAIRSHAARNARRKKQKDTRDSGSVVQIETISLDPPSPILPIQKPVKLPSIPVLLAWRPADSRVAPEEEGQIDGSLETEEETPSPVSILGQGRVDPFGTCFSTSLPVHILKYLDYAYEIVWPSICPQLREQQARWIWRRNPFLEPHSVDNHVAAAAGLAIKYDPDPMIIQEAIKIRRLHRQKSIAWINRELINASGPPSDLVTAAVIALIYHTRERNVYSYQKYRQTPLVTAQSLHIYGGCTTLPADLRFLLKLVELRGGIDRFGLVAIRSALTLVDVVFATRQGCRPALELEKNYDNLAGTPQSDRSPFETDSPLSHLGDGFDLIQNQLLSQALQACCELTIDLEHFRHHLPSSPSFNYLAHKRVGAQHALCSLTPDSLAEEDGDTLSNMVRLAALLYSDLILFAMPPASGVRERLLKELRTALEEDRGSTSSDFRHDIWLWAVTIGGVGSIMNGEQSSWYASTLRQQASHPSLQSSWPKLKDIVTRFLWWENIMDEPAFDVWTLALLSTE